MSCVSLCPVRHRAIPATGRTLEAQPQATRQRSARNPQGMRAGPADRARSRDLRGLSGAGARSAASAASCRVGPGGSRRTRRSGSTRQGTARGRGVVRRTTCQRGERQREGGALALGADQVERAAVRGGDGLGDGQAQAHAGDGVALRGGGAEEAGEQLALLAGGDADAGVADRQLGDRGGVRALVGGDLAVRRSARPARSDSVTRPPAGVNLTALETRLSQAWPSRTASPGTTRPLGGHVDDDLDAGGGGGDARRSPRRRAPRWPGRRPRAASVNRPASTCAVNSRSPTRRSSRWALRSTVVRYCALLVGERLLLVVEDELEVAEDRAQRGAQLVADQAHELVLHAFGGPGLGHVGADEVPAGVHAAVVGAGGDRRPRRCAAAPSAAT